MDEAPWQAQEKDPERLVQALAIAKAQAVAERNPGAIVIGGDQCAALDGHILGKPGSIEGAIAQLTLLRGRTHSLFTALCVVQARSGRSVTRVDEHRLTMRALSDAQIRAYVERDCPTDCAGAYKIEALGIALFERVEGSDPSAIEGLPLMLLVDVLQNDFDVDVLELQGFQEGKEGQGG